MLFPHSFHKIFISVFSIWTANKRFFAFFVKIHLPWYFKIRNSVWSKCFYLIMPQVLSTTALKTLTMESIGQNLLCKYGENPYSMWATQAIYKTKVIRCQAHMKECCSLVVKSVNSNSLDFLQIFTITVEQNWPRTSHE